MMNFGKDNIMRWLIMSAAVVVGIRVLLAGLGAVGFEEFLTKWALMGVNLGHIVLGAIALAVYDHFK